MAFPRDTSSHPPSVLRRWRKLPPASWCFTPPPSRGGNQELGSPPSQSGSFRVWGHPVAVLVGVHELPEGESSREGWSPRSPASAVIGFCSYLILHVGLLTSLTCFSRAFGPMPVLWPLPLSSGLSPSGQAPPPSHAHLSLGLLSASLSTAT